MSAKSCSKTAPPGLQSRVLQGLASQAVATSAWREWAYGVPIVARRRSAMHWLQIARQVELTSVVMFKAGRHPNGDITDQRVG